MYTHQYDADCPQPFLEDEIRNGIQKLKSMKCPGEDGITNDILKAFVEPITPIVTELFNKIFTSRTLPKEWETSIISLLYKKGDPKHMGNYRPISLLQTLYKLFTQLIMKRVTQCLDFNQPREQAGFRSAYSTVDHMFTLTQVIERYTEYNKKLYLAFVDYTKAFDTISHCALWNALKEQGVHNHYIRLLIEIYSKSKAVIKLEKKGNTFAINRGVRQGDPISP